MTEEQTPQQSSEIIDATQNAVIDVVNSISEMIEIPSESVQVKTKEPPYLSAEFWVGMAFILTLALLCRPLTRLLKGMLIKRREQIISRINEASQIRDDAQVLLAKYERMALQADEKVREMTRQTLEDIQQFHENRIHLFEASLAKRTQEADRIMQGALENALSEMTDIITKRSLEIVRSTLAQKLTITQKQKLVTLSIKRLTETMKD